MNVFRRSLAVEPGSSADMKTKLIPTQNSLRKPLRRAMIDLPNQQLADLLDLGLQAKQAHWNVKGPHFIGLHVLFDKVADELEEFADDMAERAVELGGIALGTIQIISKKSRLSAYPLDAASGQKHIAALSGALAQFETTTRAAIDTAAKAEDADTADLFTEVSRGMDKTAVAGRSPRTVEELKRSRHRQLHFDMDASVTILLFGILVILFFGYTWHESD
jgi:starvation-inducible DNA-binding protein